MAAHRTPKARTEEGTNSECFASNEKKSILLLKSRLCIYLFCCFSFIQKTVVIQPNMTIRQLALQMDLDPGRSLIEINFNRLKLVILLELKECQFLLAVSKISCNLLLID